MSIRFLCKNGHMLKTDVRHAGCKTRCPKCKTLVYVPQPRHRAARRALSDTQAMRLIGSYHPSQRSLLSAPSASPTDEERTCPRCNHAVPALCRICPDCGTYYGSN